MFLHFVIFGNEHITSADRKITAVSFHVNDAENLFYDFDAFGQVIDAKPHIAQLVGATARSACTSCPSAMPTAAPDLFYHGGGIANASYVNGRMIVRSAIPLQQLIDEWKEESNPTKPEYATFKIFDRKNGVEVEASCAPEFLSNYFQESDLPWEISPAFFRPDVLHRFKSDPGMPMTVCLAESCRADALS